jgi:iron complex outermembrane receptor protein
MGTREISAAGKVRLPLMLLLSTGLAAAADDTNAPFDIRALKGKTIEELMEMPVTSVGRKPTRYAEAASAVEVITDDVIRRSGATTLPDILRLATGVQVAHSGGRDWGITARGFNLTTANKMLVLMDGRSVYTPLFAGILWDVPNYVFADLDRIEVIRGPGATMWGANAMNGVINIASKSARETQGTVITTAAGTELQDQVSLRYGDKINENTFFRIYGQHAEHRDLVYRNGHGAGDEREHAQGGFRIDSYPWEKNLFTLQGDYYGGWNGAGPADDESIHGGNLLGRWTHQFAERSDLRVQIYYDRNDRRVPSIFREQRDTGDADVQYRFQPWERHDVVTGVNYRRSVDRINNSPGLAFLPSSRALDYYSFFLQDEIELVHEKLGLTVGSKFEHNDYTGFEVEPSVRLAYRPSREQTVWGGISRAVRMPSRLDTDLFVSSVTPTNRTLLVRGDTGFDSEEVVAYELGYRVHPREWIAFDLATFYNDYDQLRSQELSSTPNGRPAVLANKLSGEAYGAELSITAQATSWWMLRANYTVFDKRLELDRNSRDITGGAPEGNDPSHMFTIHSSWDLPGNFEFDAIARYVGRLPNPAVPSYLEMDLRLGWRATRNLDLDIVGRNLLDGSHPEFGADSPLRREVERSVYARVTWRF